MAQPGRAPASGAGGRRFESSLPDHFAERCRLRQNPGNGFALQVQTAIELMSRTLPLPRGMASRPRLRYSGSMAGCMSARLNCEVRLQQSWHGTAIREPGSLGDSSLARCCACAAKSAGCTFLRPHTRCLPPLRRPLSAFLHHSGLRFLLDPVPRARRIP